MMKNKDFEWQCTKCQEWNSGLRNNCIHCNIGVFHQNCKKRNIRKTQSQD